MPLETNTTANLNDSKQTDIFANKTLVQILLSNAKELFALDNAQFIKVIQKVIPEANFLKEDAKATVAVPIGVGKPATNFYGLTAVEEIKAFAGLICFKDVIVGTETCYNNFVACQIELKKPVLQKESFKALRDIVLSALKTPDDFAAVIWSILCNNLGKVTKISDEYKKISSEVLGHDVLLSKLLIAKPDLFSGFKDLSKIHQARIAAGYASGCDISQLEELELPPIAVAKLKDLDFDAFNLYFIHIIFEVAGAAAHFKSNGSLTMHEETWTFFNYLRSQLELVAKNQLTIEKAYKNYLDFRLKCVGIESNSKDAIALARFVGLARLATPKQGQLLIKAWQSLPEKTKTILIDELSVHGGIENGKRAIFVAFGVAIMNNPQAALLKAMRADAQAAGTTLTPEQIDLSTQEGLRIGMTVMAQVFETTRKMVVTPADKPYVAFCREIAEALQNNPAQVLSMKIEIISKGERRMDLRCVAPTPANVATPAADVTANATVLAATTAQVNTPTLAKK